ncbi:uncharacterized protein LOC142326316 isoform X2 [Lycorma delicatula]
MKIAVEGCAHGELDKIYGTLQDLEEKAQCKIDLLICCGDFQATRNCEDLECMAVPQTYQKMCTFYKYYSGEKTAPILTIFVGGNHEASNHLQELPYGGWVAPNIYYLGYAGVVNIGGLRIAGISGIYKGHDYIKGHHECPPYNGETKRSIYHVRNLEVFRLKQMKSPIDIFISHDWPRGIYNYGNIKQLLSRKTFFRDEINSNTLGSKPNEELLFELKPSYWFAAHLHCKFVAIVPHKNNSGKTIGKTKFLALDKCLPKRRFLQMIEIPHDTSKPMELHYDLEWLTILFLTNHLLSVKKASVYMPGPGSNERWKFTPTSDEKNDVLSRFNSNLKIPLNFVHTVIPYSEDDNDSPKKMNFINGAQINPQTVEFCEKLFIEDPLVLLKKSQPNLNISLNCSNISLPSFLTPDKKEITFIDDTDTSVTSSCQTTVDSESFGFNTPSRTARSSLSLPPPKNSTDVSDEDDSFKVKTPTKHYQSSLSLPVPQNINTDNDDDDNNRKEKSFELRKAKLDIEELIMDTGITSKNINSSTTDDLSNPVVKKFKRRNEAFYTNVDED